MPVIVLSKYMVMLMILIRMYSFLKFNLVPNYLIHSKVLYRSCCCCNENILISFPFLSPAQKLLIFVYCFCLQPSGGKWIKQNMVYNKTLFSHKKELIADTCYNID